MDDPAFPSTVETQTASTLTTTTRSTVGFNLEYLKSIPGILKVLELAFGLIVWACIATFRYGGSQHFVMFVAVTSWLFTLLYFIFCLISLRENMPVVSGFNWNLIEFVYSVVVTLMYLMAALDQAATTEGLKTYIAAAVFAFFVTIAYGVDAFWAFRAWRNAGGQLPAWASRASKPAATSKEAEAAA